MRGDEGCERSNDHDLVAIVQSRASLSRQRFEIIRETGEPHKILVVNIDDA